MTTAAFESIGQYEIKGRGLCIAVKNPSGYPEPEVLTGQEVLIDGEPYMVRGVESFMIARPYPDTLDFALLVEGTEWREPAVEPALCGGIYRNCYRGDDMTKALVPTYPPVPQPMESVTEPERLMALHYADVWHCLQSMQQRTNGIELLFGSAVVAGFKVDIETALDHLRSVWGHAAAAINEGRAEG